MRFRLLVGRFFLTLREVVRDEEDVEHMSGLDPPFCLISES